MIPDLPGELERIINKALEKDRQLRYQTASDLRADLDRLKRDSDSGRTAAAPTAVRPRAKRNLIFGCGLRQRYWPSWLRSYGTYRLLVKKPEPAVPFQAMTAPRRLNTHGKVGVAAIICVGWQSEAPHPRNLSFIIYRWSFVCCEPLAV